MASKARIYDYSEMRSNVSGLAVKPAEPNASSEAKDDKQGEKRSHRSKRPSVKKSTKRTASLRKNVNKEGGSKKKSLPEDSSALSNGFEVSDDRAIGQDELREDDLKRSQAQRNRSTKELRTSKTRSKSSRSNDSRLRSSARGSSGRRSSQVARESARPRDLADQVLLAWRAVTGWAQGFLDRPHGKSFYVIGASAICLILAILFLYPSVQNYYVAVRETAKSQAEYDALQDYYERVQDEAAAAKTDTGVEDLAHEELGLVKEGDNAVNVLGVEPEELDLTDLGIVPEGSIKAPDTWYSGFLDPIFGYDG